MVLVIKNNVKAKKYKRLFINTLSFPVKIEIPRRTGEGFLFLQAFIEA